MVLSRIGRVRMNQYAEAAMIEHQPGYQGREDLLGKGDLKHRPIMRADSRLVPSCRAERRSVRRSTRAAFRLRLRIDFSPRHEVTARRGKTVLSARNDSARVCHAFG